MGVENCSIILDNPNNIYYAGQTITGTVHITNSKPREIKGIRIEIGGYAHTSWSVDETYTDSEGKTQTRSVTVSGNEQYFKDRYILHGYQQSDTTLSTGSHRFNFSHILRKEIPSSFEGTVGHVRYYMKVTIGRSWKFDQHFKLCFTVITLVDLNLLPTLKQPTKVEIHKNFCCFCCTSGPLTLVALVPMTGYVSGQKIQFTIECDNASNVLVKNVIVKLVQDITYRVTYPSSDTRTSQNTIASVHMNEIVQGSSSKLWQKEIDIPPTPASALDFCSLIDLKYLLIAQASPEGMHTDLKVAIPITIGTIPLVIENNNLPSYQEAIEYGNSNNVGGATGWGLNPPAYSNLPPPIFKPSLKSVPSIDNGDDEHTSPIGGNEFAPRYPFMMQPSAPTI